MRSPLVPPPTRDKNLSKVQISILGQSAEKIASIATRFWEKVNKTEYCWEWMGAYNYFGYGRIWVKEGRIRAHRLSWELHFGAIPPGLVVCHKCDNPKCVNPDHLFLGTQKENLMDAFNKGRRSAIGPPSHSMKGDTHPLAKLTTADVVAIKVALKSGISASQLAHRFNVAYNTIDHIKHGYRWSHIQLPG